ncbi:MAG: hypothetical protein EOO60_05315 [Hymenobacter sp.]|nr:MAG: hypothetical protein EOO60_05315 [Hymenobacter sp.]
MYVALGDCHSAQGNKRRARLAFGQAPKRSAHSKLSKCYKPSNSDRQAFLLAVALYATSTYVSIKAVGAPTAAYYPAPTPVIFLHQAFYQGSKLFNGRCRTDQGGLSRSA